MKRYFVYLMLYDNGYLYTGYTSNLHRRTKQHFTKGFHAKVIWKECFYDLKEALAREQQLKGWSRAKKLALAENELDQLKVLSKRSAPKKRLLLNSKVSYESLP